MIQRRSRGPAQAHGGEVWRPCSIRSREAGCRFVCVCFGWSGSKIELPSRRVQSTITTLPFNWWCGWVGGWVGAGLAGHPERQTSRELQELTTTSDSRHISSVAAAFCYIRPYPLENTRSRLLSHSQAKEGRISSWVGDHQRILGVVCFFAFLWKNKKNIRAVLLAMLLHRSRSC